MLTCWAISNQIRAQTYRLHTTSIYFVEPSAKNRTIQMAYVGPNYKTKKDFIAAVKAGLNLTTYNPSGMFPTTQNGTDVIEGPHYPAAHKWYAAVTVKDGVVISAR
jgi:hypothetical protein